MLPWQDLTSIKQLVPTSPSVPIRLQFVLFVPDKLLFCAPQSPHRASLFYLQAVAEPAK